MQEKELLLAIILLVTVFTIVRLWVCTNTLVRIFLLACLVGQACEFNGLVGTGIGSVIGHTLFTSLLWIGSLILPLGVELKLVLVVSFMTWISRIILGHCMLSKARGADTSNDNCFYDLLYIVPFGIASLRLLQGE